MPEHILICWVGQTDLKAMTESATNGVGPIAQAVGARAFTEAVLLCNYPEAQGAAYARWLRARAPKLVIKLQHEKLTSPVHFGEIWLAAKRAVEDARKRHARPRLTFHLSPGTPPMAAVWILIAKTRFPAELLESSREHGVRTADVPFELSADFVPDLLRDSDSRLEQLAAALPPDAPEFADIAHRSPAMKRVVQMARLVALRSVPVLIEGESGTGKELLARAIHRSGARRERPFVAVNCGAIPAELVESQLFGHEKGAFTGATQARAGYFEAADGGTLFLDEVGELPPAAQVKLLRAVQEGEVTRVGATAPRTVDLRLVAATNRTLVNEVRAGRFREDLFYRLAVAVLRLPPLHARTGDVGLLVDHFLAAINAESQAQPGYRPKRLSSGARNALLAHAWPGNVRELSNTLRRAALWTLGDTIQASDVREALLDSTRGPGAAGQDVLGRAMGEGFSLPDLLNEVARHYLERALAEANGNKSEAARLVGLPSYQTLTNWMARHGVKGKR
ncbi:MAG: sigma-54-dependent Fis family transcriptional regulator [Candidatus Eisenbacteria bacterium]|uniref:Sigma-54-dependent Fis family transcriptional regulator n=1 Tax=Eiseniibacteriota bacterium TaxID=2212470 RepID=A0A933SF13_UNCEI|nr:sigma-54-dependent Fis family transcriptional regulator [Candidatus Eisenbacteria bacterium]